MSCAASSSGEPRNSRRASPSSSDASASLDHRRLRARATEPAAHRAVVEDHRLRPHVARARRPPPHHRRQRERRARLRELHRLREHVGVHRLICSGEETRLEAWIADHTRSGSSGMSILRTPRCASASITAFTYAAGEPTVADSPTPFAPIG